MYSLRIVARVLALIGIVGISILSVVPATERPTVAEAWFGELFGHLIDHVAAFALVAAAFAIGYRFSLLRLITLALVYCAGIELMQIPLPTRHARVSDFLIDFAAAAFAMALVRAGESVFGHSEEKAQSASPRPPS
jgi:VanZ family protein